MADNAPDAAPAIAEATTAPETPAPAAIEPAKDGSAPESPAPADAAKDAETPKEMDFLPDAAKAADEPPARLVLTIHDTTHNTLAAVENMLAGKEPLRAEDRADLIGDLEEYVSGQIARTGKPHNHFMAGNRGHGHVTADNEPGEILAAFKAEQDKFRMVANAEAEQGIKALPAPLVNLISEFGVALLSALVESLYRWLKQQPPAA